MIEFWNLFTKLADKSMKLDDLTTKLLKDKSFREEYEKPDPYFDKEKKEEEAIIKKNMMKLKSKRASKQV